jgi:hypothetical protein
MHHTTDYIFVPFPNIFVNTSFVRIYDRRINFYDGNKILLIKTVLETFVCRRSVNNKSNSYYRHVK